MSQENVERSYRALDAWNSGDIDAFLGFMADDVEITTALTGIEGSYRGHEGMRRWWHHFHEIFPDWHAKPLEMRAVGNATVSRLHLTGHGGESGAPVNETIWYVIRWRDGRAIRMSRHETEAEALEAAAIED